MAKGSVKRKYIILVGDGMADYPLDELGGRTPLEVAKTPNMDRIAACRIGLARTIPEGMDPGSDTANLSLLGYDPRDYLTGRAPFEAASMGIRLQPDQVAFRMNLVTLDQRTAYACKDAERSNCEIIMLSHSSGDITTKEARLIVESLKKEMVIPGVKMYPGIAYRHILVWDKGPEDAETIPPHDVLDQNMAPYLNYADNNPIPILIRRSWEVLKDHTVNIERRKKGLYEANSIWLWGQGRAPSLPLFKDKFGLRGGVISAVDLLKGIGLYAGFKSIYVKGATGYLDTNYIGKAEGALKGLERFDFIFLHVEAPDEASHNGSITEKIQAIEAFDEKVVGTILKGIAELEDYQIMVASDHFTPISKRTHSSEPAPFAWASKEEIESTFKGSGFSEESAKKSGLVFNKGHDLMPVFIYNLQ
ncbi:MAG: cofactor-independent phosphoglycerate mutase [Deltaproteobacteria bacterium]|nr:cofactor-independent phosphoglycerate mutase [Deltaproteobacteria bacterium]